MNLCELNAVTVVTGYKTSKQNMLSAIASETDKHGTKTAKISALVDLILVRSNHDMKMSPSQAVLSFSYPKDNAGPRWPTIHLLQRTWVAERLRKVIEHTIEALVVNSIFI